MQSFGNVLVRSAAPVGSSASPRCMFGICGEDNISGFFPVWGFCSHADAAVPQKLGMYVDFACQPRDPLHPMSVSQPMSASDGHHPASLLFCAGQGRAIGNVN